MAGEWCDYSDAGVARRAGVERVVPSERVRRVLDEQLGEVTARQARLERALDADLLIGPGGKFYDEAGREVSVSAAGVAPVADVGPGPAPRNPDRTRPEGRTPVEDSPVPFGASDRFGGGRDTQGRRDRMRRETLEEGNRRYVERDAERARKAEERAGREGRERDAVLAAPLTEQEISTVDAIVRRESQAWRDDLERVLATETSDATNANVIRALTSRAIMDARLDSLRAAAVAHVRMSRLPDPTAGAITPPVMVTPGRGAQKQGPGGGFPVETSQVDAPGITPYAERSGVQSPIDLPEKWSPLQRHLHAQRQAYRMRTNVRVPGDTRRNTGRVEPRPDQTYMDETGRIVPGTGGIRETQRPGRDPLATDNITDPTVPDRGVTPEDREFGRSISQEQTRPEPYTDSGAPTTGMIPDAKEMEARRKRRKRAED